MPLHYQSNFHTGTATKIRTVDLHLVRQEIGAAHAAIGLHALTGCGSVSDFYGKSKVNGAKLLAQQETLQRTLGERLKTPEVSEDLFKGIQTFVCHLYGQVGCEDVNLAKYNLFDLGKHSDDVLPPTQDTLKKHALRANYQAAIWRRSLEQLQHLPNPVSHGPYDHGWKLAEDGTLSIDWCDLPTAPESVLKTVQYACKTRM